MGKGSIGPLRSREKATATKGLLLGALSILLTACTNLGPHEPGQPFTRHGAAEIFSAGFEGVYAFYIDDPNIPDLALAGLNGLAALDPGFSASRVGNDVEIRYLGRPVAGFPAPRETDVARWSMLTTAAVSTARLVSRKIADSDPETLYRVVFDASLERLDRFTRYADAATAGRNRGSREGYSGIGVTLHQFADRIELRYVFPGGPADIAGLRPGDVLAEVDGTPTAGMDLDTTAALLRGREGSTVRVAVLRESLPHEATVERGPVIEPTVHHRQIGAVSYIKITGFNDGTTDAVRRILGREADGPAGIVFDLRGNRGGVLEHAVALADLFVENGDILETRGATGGRARPTSPKNRTSPSACRSRS